jgi:hypothetical protein
LFDLISLASYYLCCRKNRIEKIFFLVLLCEKRRNHGRIRQKAGCFRHSSLVKALHADQVDKLGNPYIEHVLVVYDALLKEGADEDTQTVGSAPRRGRRMGMLPSRNSGRWGIRKTVVEAVDAISRRKDEETYMEYVGERQKIRLPVG